MASIGEHFEGSNGLAVLIHGMTSSKAEWTEIGGYTKGGDLTRLLSGSSRSWVASDLYGHGDWVADEPGFDVEDIPEEAWMPFLDRSASGIRCAVEEAIKGRDYSFIDIITYSVGGQVGLRILREGLPLPVRRVVMAVPPPERDYDDETSLHNNLEVLASVGLTIAAGLDDEESSLDDLRWFFDQLSSPNKVLRAYEAGHSLPTQWVFDALADLEV